jgi:hypothetical protein
MTDATSTPFGSVFSASALAANPFAPASSPTLDIPNNPVADATTGATAGVSATGLGGVVSAVQGVQNIASFAGFISSVGGWQRIGLVVGGFVMVIAGLFMLGRGPTIVQQVAKLAP